MCEADKSGDADLLQSHGDPAIRISERPKTKTGEFRRQQPPVKKWMSIVQKISWRWSICNSEKRRRGRLFFAVVLAGTVGLYHFRPRFSSYFPSPQQAFLPEMGQKKVLLARSSTVFQNGRNFFEQVGR